MGDEVISADIGNRLLPLFVRKNQREVETEKGRGTSRDRQSETEGD